MVSYYNSSGRPTVVLLLGSLPAKTQHSTQERRLLRAYTEIYQTEIFNPSEPGEESALLWFILASFFLVELAILQTADLVSCREREEARLYGL